jgi:hypothetical protein
MAYNIYIVKPNLHYKDNSNHSEHYESDINKILSIHDNFLDYIKSLSYIKSIDTDYEGMLGYIHEYFPQYDNQMLDIKTCYISSDYIIQFIYDPVNTKTNEVNQFASNFSYDNKCIFGPIIITKIKINKLDDEKIKYEHTVLPIEEFSSLWESIYKVQCLVYENPDKLSLKKIDNNNAGINTMNHVIVDHFIFYYHHKDDKLFEKDNFLEILRDNCLDNKLSDFSKIYIIKYRLGEYSNKNYNSDYGSINSLLRESLINSLDQKDFIVNGLFCNIDINELNSYDYFTNIIRYNIDKIL